MANLHLLLSALMTCLTCKDLAYGDIVSLNDNNINTILGANDIAVVNFYADWCRFSQILKPTFEEAGNKIQEDFPTPGRVVFAKVDSDKETGISGRYRINKYPTIKLFRAGNVVKKEYRGQRSVEALVQFAKDQAKDPVEELSSLTAINELDTDKKGQVIGFFDNKESTNYKTFSRIASILRDDCQFHAAIGPVSESERTGGDKVSLKFKDKLHSYSGDIAHADSLQKWTAELCTPLVREITFENAEELTEEGLPFLILFHHPDDKETVNLFHTAVTTQILHEKVNVNFLTADGLKFAHPLHHLGKSTNDLPILAIDSFRHMYLFPHDVKKELNTPGVLKSFVEDLHSGKLHREFHHGPDATTTLPPQIEQKSDSDGDTKNIPRDTSDEPKVQKSQQKITSPPESTFRKLAPSRNRYTILRDEL